MDEDFTGAEIPELLNNLVLSAIKDLREMGCRPYILLYVATVIKGAYCAGQIPIYKNQNEWFRKQFDDDDWPDTDEDNPKDPLPTKELDRIWER